MSEDTYLYVKQAHPDLYEQIVAFSSVVNLRDEVKARYAIEKFCMYLVDACKYALAVFIVLLSCGVAEAKDVVIEYQDFLKMVSMKDRSDKTRDKLAAENAVLVKLKDEQGSIITIQKEQIKACEEIVAQHERMGETEQQISKALQDHILDAKKIVETEKRLSRYKSEAFVATGIIAAITWLTRR